MPEKRFSSFIGPFPIDVFGEKDRKPTQFDRFKTFQVRQLEGAYDQHQVNKITNEQWLNAFGIQELLHGTYSQIEVSDESASVPEPLARSDFSLYFNNDELVMALMRRDSLYVGDLTSVDRLFRKSKISGDSAIAMSLKTMNIERYGSLVDFAKDAGIDIPDPKPNGTFLLNDIEINLDEFVPPAYGTEEMGSIVRRYPYRFNPISLAYRRAPVPRLGIRPAIVIEPTTNN